MREYVEAYGYAAVFAGCALEGETTLVLGGFAAYLGYLWLPAVVGVAALGGFASDEAVYAVGRLVGPRILARFPRLAEVEPRVRALASRHGTLLVFLLRFLVGFRIAIPLVIGATRAMSPWRFALPNAAGALLWGIVVGGAGYAFGDAFVALVEDAARYPAWALVAIAAGTLAAYAIRRRASRRRA